MVIISTPELAAQRLILPLPEKCRKTNFHTMHKHHKFIRNPFFALSWNEWRGGVKSEQLVVWGQLILIKFVTRLSSETRVADPLGVDPDKHSIKRSNSDNLYRYRIKSTLKF